MPAETLMGKFRDGMPVTGEAVTLILATIDRIKEILAELEDTEAEPDGTDQDLIDPLVDLSMRDFDRSIGSAGRGRSRLSPLRPRSSRARWCRRCWSGRCVRAKCRSTNWSARSARPRSKWRRRRSRRAARSGCAEAGRSAGAARSLAKDKKPPPPKSVVEIDVPEADKVANQSIRVNVDTLEHLMTMVSELVLTRNQLLEISAATTIPNSRCRCSGCPTSPPSCRKAS